ncbi:hypothetical protein BO71DRAFT_394963 [Aspergillus ellipticus CBS 707.79]|uniref:Chromo domain-containing protein n=1 Tax=Aspergillus ellipticus CBS 707.79 TaxID=1448320 RepID=A0A319F266_9EURO|nr:hypothetical protein BO71DRAFT_394963 [Aspergillus ellipticus CBS 707.79]
MPPPVPDVSDDESSTGESIPYDDAPEAKREQVAKDEDDDENEEDVFTVEKIMGHEWKNGQLQFHVKWKGYDDPADMTVEPEKNLLDGAKDVVDEYFRVLGGRPEKPQAKKRKSMGRPPKSTAEKQQPEPKRRRKSRGETATTPPDEDDGEGEAEGEGDGDSEETTTWVPRSKNWENEVENVETIIREPGTTNLLAFLNWKNGKKSKVSIETCYDRCPKKMLKFYEQHLVFKDG